MPSKNNPHNLLLPKNFKEKDMPFFEPHFNFVLKKPVLSIMTNIFYFDNGIVTDIWLNKETNYLPWQTWGSDYTKQIWIGKILRALKARRVKLKVARNLETGIVANVFSGNYFHWMTEAIPKLLFLKREYPNKIIIFFDHYLQDFQKKSLELMQIDYTTVDADIIFFKKVSTVSNFAEYPGYYHEDWIRKVRELFIGVRCNYQPNSFNRLYISRSKTGRRKIINEDELKPVLEKYGFAIVYPEELNFMESIKLYKNAKILVSCHGAALTNMIFLPKDAKVLELQLKEIITDKCYYLLSNACKLDYYYQGCENPFQQRDHVNADIIVDVHEFESNLALMLQN